MDTDPRTHATLELILAFQAEGRDFAALEKSDPEHAAALIDAMVLHDEGDDVDATVAGLYGDDDDADPDDSDLDDADPTDSELDMMDDAEPHPEPEEDDESD